MSVFALSSKSSILQHYVADEMSIRILLEVVAGLKSHQINLEPNQLTPLHLFRFHASWCKSCQKFGVMYKKLALDDGDVTDFKTKELVRQGEVRFAEIEFGANARLCRSLGIKRLPNVHIYKGAVGLVTAFPCGPSKFPLLVEKLESYRAMTDDELSNERKMEEGGVLGDSIVTELSQEHWEEALLEEEKKHQRGSSP
jgi:hypothetical protein